MRRLERLQALVCDPFSCDPPGMDNLTHSLVGALLGQMGLKRRTGLAMPTLIIAANIPDIDATCTIWGMQSLAMRRGITHGPIALLVLPLILAGAMVGWDRWQKRRGKRPSGRLPVRFGWLLVLAYIGCLSHPALDWLNNYGIRLLEPFSHQWFYGDTLFIIDLWIWIALILAVGLSLRRERARDPQWRKPAWIGFAAISLYIFGNGLITNHSEGQAVDMLAKRLGHTPELVVARARPLTFWRRETLWRDGDLYGSGTYAVGAGTRLESPRRNLFHKVDLRPLTQSNPDARALLFWSRMPVVQRHGDTMRLSDQRFDDRLTAGNFSLTFPAVE